MTPLAAALALSLHLFPSADAGSVARGPRDAGGEIDVSALPPEQKAGHAVFRHKCGGCHTLARAVGSRLPPDAWKRHVRRMARRPGTALSEEQAQSILAFVDFYARRMSSATGGGASTAKGPRRPSARPVP